MTNTKSFLFSVHDVAPVHLKKLMKAEELIDEYKISEVCFLLVPDFHNQGASDASKVFLSWIQRTRSYSVEWFLHGYYHKETGLEVLAKTSGIMDKLKRAFLTEGEGEFFGLLPEKIKERLERGKAVYRNLIGKDDVYGFVAPAWLFKPDLFPCLKETGFTLTEDHHNIYNVKKGIQVKSPVITWATRTTLRKYGSLVICPLLSSLWKKEPLLRIAVHPSDFAYSDTVDNIRRVLDWAMLERQCISYRDVGFAS